MQCIPGMSFLLSSYVSPTTCGQFACNVSHGCPSYFHLMSLQLRVGHSPPGLLLRWCENDRLLKVILAPSKTCMEGVIDKVMVEGKDANLKTLARAMLANFLHSTKKGYLSKLPWIEVFLKLLYTYDVFKLINWLGSLGFLKDHIFSSK